MPVPRVVVPALSCVQVNHSNVQVEAEAQRVLRTVRLFNVISNVLFTINAMYTSHEEYLHAPPL